MSKVRNLFSKRKIKISKELLHALENAQLPEDILEQIISILFLAQEAKRKGMSKDIVISEKSDISPEEILMRTYNRLDGLIERTEEIKSRVDTINFELKKIAYFS